MFYTSDSYNGKKDTLLKTGMFYSRAAEQGGCIGICLGKKEECLELGVKRRRAKP